jgi:hypothetical protein
MRLRDFTEVARADQTLVSAQSLVRREAGKPLKRGDEDLLPGYRVRGRAGLRRVKIEFQATARDH